jgi:dTDP-4-amino-4,6-dideoxygalactose transaminase
VIDSYDDTDVLAADIADVLKRHGEEFDNEDELQGWLDEDGIAYTERSLAMALAQLEQIGRIKRPRADRWNTADRDLPGFWIPPKIFNEGR